MTGTRQRYSRQPHIRVDCIPDLHYSPHIAPPLLPKLKRTHYDLFLVEFGAGLNQSPGCELGETSPFHQMAHHQMEQAKEWGTLDIGAAVAEAVRCRPVTIDHPQLWFRTVKQFEKLSNDLPKGTDGRPQPPENAWSDPKYRMQIITLFQQLLVRRDTWMAEQVKHLLSVVSGKNRRSVRALLMVGLGHATVLANALSQWCTFRYLIDLRTIKAAVIKYLRLSDEPSKQQVQRLRSFSALRNELIETELCGWGVPETVVASVVEEVGPDTLDGLRIEREYYPSGIVKVEAAYRRGQLDGIARWYDEQGRLETKANYKKGQFHGVATHYSPDGHVEWESHYKNGKCILQRDHRKAQDRVPDGQINPPR